MIWQERFTSAFLALVFTITVLIVGTDSATSSTQECGVNHEYIGDQ
jgi:hypothetical protein